MPPMDESFGDRFSALLQPIRDLAENWNIDIANELEDYLEDLEDIQIAFDGGEKSLNFAEAALLIQGSTCVYSRKVEFLYTLVFRTLDLIAEKKRSRPESSIDADGNDADIDPRLFYEEEFILLDDIPEAKSHSINLGPLDEQVAAAEAGSHLLAPAPVALSLHEGDSFQMQNCSVHASGLLLLDHSDHVALSGAGKTIYQAGEGPAMPSPVPMANDCELDMDDDDDFSIAVGDVDDADGTAGNDEASDPAANLNNLVRNAISLQAELDPWAALDPHEEHPELVRPYRRGKTSRTPKDSKRTVLEAPPSAAAFLAALSKPSPSALTGTYFQSQFGDFYAAEMKRRKESSLSATVQQAASTGPADLQHDEIDQPVGDFGGAEYDAGDFDAGVLSDGDDELDDIDPIVMEVSEATNRDRRLSNVVKSFEDLCREHMEKHALEAEKLSNDQGMSRRVSEWQSSLAPILEQEEQRKPFDIHACGDEMLARMAADAPEEPVEFLDIITKEKGDAQHDVCRMFLACLQLANTGNLHIERPGETDVGMRLTLLERTRKQIEACDLTAVNRLPPQKPGTGPQARKPKGKRPPSKEAAIRKPTQSKGKAKAVDALGSSSNQQQPAVGLRRSTRKRS